MAVKVHAIGRLKRGPETELVERYTKRLKRLKTTIRELPEGASKEQEGDALLASLPPQAFILALDERGEGFTTTENRRSSMAKTPPSRRLSEIVRAVFRHTGRSASGDFPGLRAPSHKYVPCREPVAAPHAHIRLA